MKYSNSSKNIIGLSLAVITIFIWGITFVSTKYLLSSFSALEILIIRFVAAYAGLWILCPHPLHLKLRWHELYFLSAGFFGVTAYQFMENMAISYTSASNVSIIVSVCPIFTALTAQFFLHEKTISFRFISGFVIAILGITLVSFNGAVVFHFNPKGDFLALAAAVSWSLYSVFLSKLNGLGFSTLQTTRRIFFWALIFMIPLIFVGMQTATSGSHSGFSIVSDLSVNIARFSNPINWFNILFLGLGASAFCFAAWSKACAFLGTVRTTVGIYLIPVVTIIFAFFALGEKITVIGMMGAILTLSGLIISEWKPRYRCH